MYPNYTKYSDEELEAKPHQELVNLVQAKTDTVDHLTQRLKQMRKSRKNLKRKLRVVVKALQFYSWPKTWVARWSDYAINPKAKPKYLPGVGLTSPNEVTKLIVDKTAAEQYKNVPARIALNRINAKRNQS